MEFLVSRSTSEHHDKNRANCPANSSEKGKSAEQNYPGNGGTDPGGDKLSFLKASEPRRLKDNKRWNTKYIRPWKDPRKTEGENGKKLR
jgi:hypothetical protein